MPGGGGGQYGCCIGKKVCWFLFDSCASSQLAQGFVEESGPNGHTFMSREATLYTILLDLKSALRNMVALEACCKLSNSFPKIVMLPQLRMLR